MTSQPFWVIGSWIRWLGGWTHTEALWKTGIRKRTRHHVQKGLILNIMYTQYVVYPKIFSAQNVRATIFTGPNKSHGWPGGWPKATYGKVTASEKSHTCYFSHVWNDLQKLNRNIPRWFVIRNLTNCVFPDTSVTRHCPWAFARSLGFLLRYQFFTSQ